MKKIILILLMYCVVISSVSCSSTRKITIHGTPKTVIYSPSKNYVATIAPDGKATVKVDIDCPYLLAKSNNSIEYVPFAIDIKDCYELWDLPFGVAIASFPIQVWTWPLLPFYHGVLFKKDKPLDSQTNNDMF